MSSAETSRSGAMATLFKKTLRKRPRRTWIITPTKWATMKDATSSRPSWAFRPIFTPEDAVRFRFHFKAGFAGVPLVGTPEQIVELFKKYSDWGIDGIALTWLDYHQGIKDFVAGVQPLMEAAGLREPFSVMHRPCSTRRAKLWKWCDRWPPGECTWGPTPIQSSNIFCGLARVTCTRRALSSSNVSNHLWLCSSQSLTSIWLVWPKSEL